ncbi:GNAT family N-acetyltransferase [Micromonospora polyrhachis]|uniref:GNAT superfamily N-acetyltransferase n=1 Tax=Micromonospora polyrhachis TaxID=1282883 RepID=A0A7W7WMW3_9ACTN|nr:GNAT family N-acetyltransferase [Micromonospora polyrhachis]MBB4957230.1 GNAT superfamily N-acetyltransferase [Micromonospora polyrhachis]
MEKLIFRTAQRADVPAIVAMLADDGLGKGREVVGEEVDAAYWAAFAEMADDPNNTQVVVEVGGEVVGTLQLTYIRSLTRRGGLRAQIEGVRVRADQRGAGLGRTMIKWAVDQARERGCNLVQLTTDKRRADAHRFYASLGFRASHEGMKLVL